MRFSDTEQHNSGVELSDQIIIEQQAVKFAKEFSNLYRLEKKKREELQVVSNELKERNEELMDIVFLTSNQFREPLNKLEANIVLIKEHKDSSQRITEGWFDETEKSVAKLQRLVSEMSKLYKIKSLRNLFHPVSMDKLLAEVLDDMKTALERKRVTVNVEALPILETDSVQMRILLNQLIMTGSFYKCRGEPVALTIKADSNARGLKRITLVSQGMGVGEHHLYFKNYAGRNGFDRRLDLCQRISHRLGGFLYGEKTSDKTFSYHVVLPEKNIPLASHLKSRVGDF